MPTHAQNGPVTAGRRALLASSLVLLLLLVPATAAWSAPSGPDVYTGPEKCALCHPVEAETWQASPHSRALDSIQEAMQLACGDELPALDCTCLSCHTTDFELADLTYAHAGVTCEACHGAYVEGHPTDGVMQLSVDSSICQSCHVDTYRQWEMTAHGEAGVQCIGCHRAHSQGLRLTDQTLCQSCHREQLQDPGHVAHLRLDVDCIACHTSPAVALASTDPTYGHKVPPDHHFDVVTEACASCHGQSFHDQSVSSVANQLATTAPLVQELPARAVAVNAAPVDQPALSTPALAGITLGVGMGIGIMIGVVGVLVVGTISQARRQQ